MSDKVFVGPNVSDLDIGEKPTRISRVNILVDSEHQYTAGDDTGRTMEKTVPWGSQAMADAILSAVKNYDYQPFNGTDALIDPAAEIGDGITVGGVYSVLIQKDIEFGHLTTTDIAAPGTDEIDDEYPYLSRAQRQANRLFAQTRSSITKTAEQIRLEVQKEVEGLSSSFTVELGDIKAELQDSINGLSASVDLRFEGIEATFSDEIEGLSAEFSAGLSGLSSRVEQVATDASRELADYADVVTRSLGDLQNQIDGQIMTWFYSYEPTTENEPASLWETDDEKIKHLGDVFYIVDDPEKGGQAYRWEYVGGTYRWSLIEDVEVAKALADAAKAQDTADHKRRNFTEQPKPPYDVGDFWSQGPKGDLMRCKTARSSGNYVESDWEKASEYTDDSYARTKYTELKQTIDGITLTATNGDQSSTLTLTSGNTVLTSADITFNGLTKFVSKDSLSSGETDINGACIKTGKVAAEYLELTGAIGWNDLHSTVQSQINNIGKYANDAIDSVNGWTYKGSTYIDGAKIMTGTVMASNLLGGSVGLLGEDDYGDPIQVGGIDITLTNNDEDYGLEFWTDRNMGGIRMMSAGTIYLASWVDKSSRYTKPLVQIGEDNVYIGGGANLLPQEAEALNLGDPYFRWYDVYTVNSVTTISDRNLKTNISYDLSAYDALFDLLKPVSFQYAGKYSQSGRTHLGLISQDVETAIADAGLSSMDFAGFVKSPVSGENSVYSLREEEFLPMCIRRVQQLTKRVAELEKRMGAVM